jgi:hypothetical protein
MLERHPKVVNPSLFTFGASRRRATRGAARVAAANLAGRTQTIARVLALSPLRAGTVAYDGL